VLGTRLRECCEALLALDAGADAEAVLGGIDAIKLRSSMTLFALAAPGEPPFTQVLERYYDGSDRPGDRATSGRYGVVNFERARATRS